MYFNKRFPLENMFATVILLFDVNEPRWKTLSTIL